MEVAIYIDHEQCFKAYNYKDNERKRNKTSTEKGLSQRLFFNGKTIKGCFQGSTLDQLLEYYSQAIRYNERNLNIIKEIVCTTFFHIGSMKEKLIFEQTGFTRKLLTEKLLGIYLSVNRISIFLHSKRGRRTTHDELQTLIRIYCSSLYRIR
ncbi:odorant receptor 13a-like [Vespula squamosa]|uniref:Odorant receptor 13a-like n=1 Tax=Vespula squamosa TaxID=30214 RepID=A0ABD2BAB7_VESSQ